MRDTRFECPDHGWRSETQVCSFCLDIINKQDAEILCPDCNDSGWNEDREGRSPCSCVSETEPYQLLEQENKRLRNDMHFIMKHSCESHIVGKAEQALKEVE